jgi:hypothetical protein
VQAGAKKTVNMALPDTGTNSATVAPITSGSGTGLSALTAKASASLSVTGTWQPAGGNATTDPAPPGIMVSEAVTAYALGSASNASGSIVPFAGSVSDGLNDGLTPSPTTGQVSGQTYVTESGGSFTINLTISANVSATPGPPYTVNGANGLGTCTVSAGIGPVSISIHPQPYNFRLDPNNPPIEGADGSLVFSFLWSSTDGSLSDLGSISCYEYVTYNGNPGTYVSNVYYPPDPPVETGYPNPTGGAAAGNQGPGVNGGFGDDQMAPAFVKPYSSLTYTATQYYRFKDSATGQVDVPIPGSISYPISIVRSINQQVGGYVYTCSKLGYSSFLVLP